jgi:lantibiotic protection ABC transporter MutE/EpiE family permease subunit
MNNSLSKNNSWMWQSLLALVFNWWPVVFLPLGFALFATLVATQEKKSGNYRALRAHDVSPMVVWINKIIAIAIYSLFSMLVLVAATVFAGLFLKFGTIPFEKIILASVVCWVTSLALIPIQLWASTWNGIFLSMGIGFVGMIAGVIAAPKPFWTAVPWSWATRQMCFIIGVHPNGAVLEAGNPLLNTSVLPVGVAISLVAFLTTTVLTAVWFNRREEK